MEKIELVKEAINFAMSALCDGYLDMPSGCEGCPLWDEDNLDDYGNVNCRGAIFMEFAKKHPDDLIPYKRKD